MLLVQVITLLFWALFIPVCMGAGAAAFVDKQEKNIAFMWIAGYLLYMAVFQIISVPFILLQGHMSFGTRGAFSALVQVFECVSVIAALGSIIIRVIKMKNMSKLRLLKKTKAGTERVLWLVFGVLLLLQLILAVFLAFSDGDDAYYVAVSTVTESSDTMYMVIPYTGMTTELDIRHGLAPFPILIAFLARVSGIHPAAVAHIAMPLLLIPLTYCIYGMIGNMLFKGKSQSLPVFMIFVELLVIWGNYSLYTAETFLITRTRQGKAALGNIVIPALFLLLYMIGEKLQENKKVSKCLWGLVFALMTAACLCSTLGGFLIAVLLGVFGLCTIICYKKWMILLPLILCLIPAGVYIGLYLVLD